MAVLTPSLRSAVTGNTTTTANLSITTTLPASITAGDQLAIVVQVNIPSATIGLPTGAGTWVQKSTDTDATDTGVVFIKTADGSESGATVTMVPSGSCRWSVFAVATKDCDPVNPIQTFDHANGGIASTTAHDAPSLTITAASVFILWIFGTTYTNLTTRGYTMPGGVTEVADINTQSRVGLAIGTETVTATGPTGIRTATCSNGARFVTFSIAYQGAQPSITDTLGLTDSMTSVLTLNQSQTDPLGLTDTASGVLTLNQSVTDPLGLVDSASGVAAYNRSQTDALGLTDSVVADLTLGPRTQTDALGLTDSMSSTLARPESVVDPFGLTDSVLAELTLVASFTDTIGLLDSVVAPVDRVAIITDSLGLTDLMTYGIGAGLAEAFGLSDSMSYTIDRVATFTDPFDLSDAVDGALTLPRTITDTIGFTDDATGQKLRLEVLTDTFGLVDAMSDQHGFAAFLTDALALSDSVATVTDLHMVLTDTFGLVDDTTPVLDRLVTIIDTLHLHDVLDVFFSGPYIGLRMKAKGGAVAPHGTAAADSVRATGDSTLED